MIYLFSIKNEHITENFIRYIIHFYIKDGIYYYHIISIKFNIINNLYGVYIDGKFEEKHLYYIMTGLRAVSDPADTTAFVRPMDMPDITEKEINCHPHMDVNNIETHFNNLLISYN